MLEKMRPIKSGDLEKQVGINNKRRVSKCENEQKYKYIVTAIAGRAIVIAFDVV